MVQFVFLTSKVVDEFIFVLFLLPSTKETRDEKELAIFVKENQTSNLEAHWELIQKEYKRKGIMTTSAAKDLGVLKKQSKQM